MELASACIDRQGIKFCRLQDELVEWRNKCVESKSFVDPANANAIDFETLYDELSHRTRLFNKSYPDDDNWIVKVWKRKWNCICMFLNK
jgi:hypothetical protein